MKRSANPLWPSGPTTRSQTIPVIDRLDRLPAEMQSAIVDYLDPISIGKMRRVNRTFKDIAAKKLYSRSTFERLESLVDRKMPALEFESTEAQKALGMSSRFVNALRVYNALQAHDEERLHQILDHINIDDLSFKPDFNLDTDMERLRYKLLLTFPSFETAIYDDEGYNDTDLPFLYWKPEYASLIPLIASFLNFHQAVRTMKDIFDMWLFIPGNFESVDYILPIFTKDSTTKLLCLAVARPVRNTDAANLFQKLLGEDDPRVLELTLTLLREEILDPVVTYYVVNHIWHDLATNDAILTYLAEIHQ